MLYGTITGDIVGSIYEFHNIKTKDFPLFCDESMYTDDSIMTLAIAEIIQKGYSRIPVFSCNNQNDLIGIVRIKQLLGLNFEKNKSLNVNS